VELRALEIAVRLLDPRKWRQRLAQLGGGIAILGWIWFRAASRAEIVRAVADAKHAERDAVIRADNARREAEKLSA
jgi:hypothetical protein